MTAAPSRGPHGWAGRGWRRGGRWDRVLAALYHRDLTEPAIRFATQTGEHPRKVECKKVKRALTAMARAGLIQRQATTYTITARGSQTLRDGRIPPRPADYGHGTARPHSDAALPAAAIGLLRRFTPTQGTTP